jgi:hypothetical protein
MSHLGIAGAQVPGHDPREIRSDGRVNRSNEACDAESARRRRVFRTDPVPAVAAGEFETAFREDKAPRFAIQAFDMARQIVGVSGSKSSAMVPPK